MKKILFCWTALIFICLFAFTCSQDDSTSSKQKTYDSFGSWPQYAGNWESMRQVVGSRSIDDVYLDIKIEDNGLFSGTYQSYMQTGTMPISIGIVTVYEPVYDPDGNKKNVNGALDFDNDYGIATFAGLGEIEFTIYRASSSELKFTFPSDFTYDFCELH